MASQSKSLSGIKSKAPETSILKSKSKPHRRLKKILSKGKTVRDSNVPRMAPLWYRESWNNDFEGGPKISKVLHSYADPISHTIWEIGGTTRDVTKFSMHHKPEAFKKWSLEDEKNESMKQYCNNSGLSILLTAHSPGINKPLIHALLERYMPETNTFHLPIGEVTVTLDDMYKITKLNIAGGLLQGERVSNKEGEKLLTDYMGIPHEDVVYLVSEGSVNLKWLRDTYKGRLPADETDRVKIDRFVHAYLLNVLGETIFSDKSGNKVSLNFLRDFVDVDSINHKAWGLAALMYLLRQLTINSKAETQQLCGYMQLIEIWAYLHMPELLPDKTKKHPEWKESRAGRSSHTPYIKRYEWKKVANTSAKLMSYRSFLDNLNPAQWIWYPYGYLKFHQISLFNGYLVSYDLYEPHPADRVRRQFGNFQDVPSREVLKRNLTPIHGREANETIIPFMADMLKNYRDYVPGGAKEFAVEDTDVEMVSDEYYEWYKKISHLKVTPPTIEQRKKEEKYLDDMRVDVGEKLQELITECGQQMDAHKGMKEAFSEALAGLMTLGN